MTTKTADTLLQSIRTLAGEAGEGETDQELLDRFVREHDETAFTAILGRHGPMVLAACRRALREAHSAEDVFQATFLTLARNAGAIRNRRSLGGWLHGVALRLARKANAAAARGKEGTHDAPESPHGPAEEASWREVRQILDEELALLPEGYRLPLILCYLEGRTREEAAAEMGCTPGRLKGLLERGRERLRVRLVRRGLAPAAVGAILLTETALATPVPPLLAVTTVRVALNSRAVNGLANCGASATVRSLVEGGLPMSGVKSLLLALAFALLAGAAGLGMSGEPPAPPAPPVRAAGNPQPGKGPPAPVNPKAEKPDDEAAVKAHIKALSDPNNETRAIAAGELRRIVAKYPSGTVYIRTKDGGEAAWQEKINTIDVDMDKKDVLKVLPPFAEAPEQVAIASGQSHVVSYRLDYHWCVTVSYRNTDKIIERPKLTRRALRIYVAPPKNYTGAWVTWHVNGQKGYEIQFRDGQYDGTFTSFHDNGKKHTEQHYVNGASHGTGTGWFPNGKLSYSTGYSNGKQDGVWTHWYANGNKHSEINYHNGQYHGRYTRWHENGQLAAINDYKEGVKHGREASWNENGVLDYDRKFENGEIVE